MSAARGPAKRRREAGPQEDGLLISPPDVFGRRRRRREIPSESADDTGAGGEASRDDCMISDTHAALLLLLAEGDDERAKAGATAYPRIVFKHQLYTIVSDRTVCDRESEQLRKEGIVIFFRLGCTGIQDIAIMLVADYSALLQAAIPSRPALAEAFATLAADSTSSISISREKVLGVPIITEADLTVLLSRGCVALRDAHSYWLSFPNSGVILKSLRNGREQLLRMIRIAKYNEVLQRDLMKRKLKGSKLGMKFHISDAVGSGILLSISTTSGPLIRLPDA